MAPATLRLTLAYDGTAFVGSQVQPGGRTVQGELERALAVLAGRPIPAVLAGRTDRGVHAAGQVASCADAAPGLEPGRLLRALNAHLPPDLAVVSAGRGEGFHARYDARWREYRYRVWCGPRQPAALGWSWHRTGSLDPGAMRDGAARLVGERDFAALAGGGEGVPWSPRQRQPRGTVRTVTRCDCRELPPWWGPGGSGQLIEVRVVADGFLPRMVRNIVALLAEVGRGERSVAEVDAVLAGRDRRAGPAGTAPAHGLTLWRVGYDEERPEDLAD